MKQRKYLFVVAIFLCLVTVNASSVEKGYENNYSDAYKKWLNLSEEEREKTVSPLPVDVKYKPGKKINMLGDNGNNEGEEEIPERYNLKDHITIEVKNQLSTNECWAFSASSTVETNLALKGENIQLSERHMDYDTTYSYKGDYYCDNFNDSNSCYNHGIKANPNALSRRLSRGATSFQAFTYYSRGSGPILEKDMEFKDNEFLIDYEDLPKGYAIKQVENMIYFPGITKTISNELIYNNGAYSQEDVDGIRDMIKEHIMTNGAVSTDINTANMSYYYNPEEASLYVNQNFESDHTVTIVGWDDNYSKTKFVNQPYHDGAWIVLNSWGNKWGDNGYFYVSYDDLNVENNVRGVISVGDIDYDNIYQHDTSDMMAYRVAKSAANVFTAKGNEMLTEVTIGSYAYQNVNVYVIPNITSSGITNDLNMDLSNKVVDNYPINAGYTNIVLDTPVELTKGNKFAIIVEMLDEGGSVGVESNARDQYGNLVIFNVKSNPNESFYSQDGIIWNDLYDATNNQNFIIKGYTVNKANSAKITDVKYSTKRILKSSGGDAKLLLTASNTYNGKNISVKLYNSSNVEKTSLFTINAEKIKSTKSHIKITIPSGVDVGNYTVKVLCDSAVIAQKQITIYSDNFDTSKYIKVKFPDQNLYESLKFHMLKDEDVYAYFDNTKEIIINKGIDYLNFSIQYYDETGKTFIYGKGYGIEGIKGLDKFTDLYFLSVTNSKIRDVSPLASLKNLTNLSIYNADLSGYGLDNTYEMTGLEAIYGLTDLTVLELTDIGLTDISFVSKLTKLTALDFQNNKIRDITPLANLKDLNSLILSNNEITDISPLANLTKLGNLAIECNNIVDVSPLTKLKNITGTFYLYDNNIRNLHVLDGMENIGNSPLWYAQELDYISTKRNAVEVPITIQKTFDEDSNIYSSLGVSLEGCSWNEQGKSINFDDGSDECRFEIKSGIAFTTNGRYIRINYVDAESVTGIEIIREPYKKTYVQGDSLSYGGGIVKISFSDGTNQIFDLVDDIFTISGYDKNKEGEQEITVSFGNYEDTYNVTIEKRIVNVSSLVVSSIPAQTYTSAQIKPALTIKDGNYTLKLNEDYTVSYSNNINAGTGSITITGKGNYTGTVKKTFVINKANLSKVAVSISKATYNGTALKPALTAKLGNYSLKAGTDYTVTYKNNTKAGTGSLTITGKGNFTGSKTSSFTINKASIKNAVYVSQDQNYTGKAIKYNPTLKYGSYVLKKDVDYTLSYKNNKNLGKATVVVTGKGSVTGSVNLSFNIVVSKVTGLAQSASGKDYVTIKWNKNTLVDGYEIYYSTNKTSGFKKVRTISKNGTTTYKKTGLKPGVNYYFKIKSYKTVNGKRSTSAFSSLLETATTPKKVAIKNPTSKGGVVTINWTKLGDSTGYEIFYSTSKTTGYKKLAIISKNGTISYQAKNLVKGKTYYFKVRAFKKAETKTYFGDYSDIKNIKVK